MFYRSSDSISMLDCWCLWRAYMWLVSNYFTWRSTF